MSPTKINTERSNNAFVVILFVSLLIIAAVDSVIYVTSKHKSTAASVGLLLGLWACAIGVAVVLLNRRRLQDSQKRIETMRLFYETQLDKEVLARAEYEQSVHASAYKSVSDEYKVEMEELRAELSNLRHVLEKITGKELDEKINTLLSASNHLAITSGSIPQQNTSGNSFQKETESSSHKTDSVRPLQAPSPEQNIPQNRAFPPEVDVDISAEHTGELNNFDPHARPVGGIPPHQPPFSENISGMSASEDANYISPDMFSPRNPPIPNHGPRPDSYPHRTRKTPPREEHYVEQHRFVEYQKRQETLGDVPDDQQTYFPQYYSEHETTAIQTPARESRGPRKQNKVPNVTPAENKTSQRTKQSPAGVDSTDQKRKYVENNPAEALPVIPQSGRNRSGSNRNMAESSREHHQFQESEDSSESYPEKTPSGKHGVPPGRRQRSDSEEKRPLSEKPSRHRSDSERNSLGDNESRRAGGKENSISDRLAALAKETPVISENSRAIRNNRATDSDEGHIHHNHHETHSQRVDNLSGSITPPVRASARHQKHSDVEDSTERTFSTYEPSVAELEERTAGRRSSGKTVADILEQRTGPSSRNSRRRYRND